jgi:hypothetical protein
MVVLYFCGHYGSPFVFVSMTFDTDDTFHPWLFAGVIE